MLLPILITLFFGTMELSTGLAISRKITLTSHTVADLASQLTTVKPSDSTDMLAASSSIMWPFVSNPATANDQAQNLKIILSCVNIDVNGNATIAWSDASTGAAHAKGSATTVPAALKIQNTHTGLLWGEASASYTPTFATNLMGTMTLSDQFYMAPRKQMTCPAHT